MPYSLIWRRFSSILIPYFVLYRLSNCLSLGQGKRSQLSEQYGVLLLARRSQFLIVQLARDWAFRVSDCAMLRQPGQGFFSRMKPQQRRQFIPQGAISLIGIVGGIFRLGAFITIRFNLAHAEAWGYGIGLRTVVNSGKWPF